MTLLCQALDETVDTEPLTLSDMLGMEAAFATNAATGVRPVVSVDSTQWPSEHKALTELYELYADIPAEQVARCGGCHTGCRAARAPPR